VPIAMIANADGLGRIPFDDDFLVFIPLLALIDWRCFISVDRYPRVGLTRTASVLALFLLPFLLDGWRGPQHLMFPSLMLTALVISIQLLAPHHQTLAAQIDAEGKPKPTPNPNNDASADLALKNTRPQQLEIHSPQETV